MSSAAGFRQQLRNASEAQLREVARELKIPNWDTRGIVNLRGAIVKKVKEDVDETAWGPVGQRLALDKETGKYVPYKDVHWDKATGKYVPYEKLT